MTTARRFWSKVEIGGQDDCWPWTGATQSGGYGSFGVGSRTDGSRRSQVAHRVAYELTRGEIPSGTEIDHLCRNPKCCNPLHLETVTHRENMRRGDGWAGVNARKTHCPAGHPYDAENTEIRANGKRYCRACDRARPRAPARTRTLASGNPAA